MANVPTYRYFFEIATVQTAVVNPGFDDNFAIEEEQESGQAFYRPKITGKLTFVRDDYSFIIAQDIETEILFIIEQNISGIWAALGWQGVFTKADCEIDESQKIITATMQTRDAYEDVMAGLNKEFNLIELSPATTALQMVKQPLIQVYIPGQTFVTNFLGGTYWEQEAANPTSDGGVLTGTYKFALATTVNFIPGSGDLSPDVSGEYDSGFIRLDGHYEVEFEDLSPNFKWRIIDLFDSNNVVYEGAINESEEVTTFISQTDPGSQCRFRRTRMYSRYLTNELTVNGTPTLVMPDPDILAENFNYTRVLSLDLQDNFTPYDGHSSTTPGRYGKFSSTALHFANEYFQKFTLPDRITYPINRTNWDDHSIWFHFTDDELDLQEDGAETFILKDAYKIADVISVLLGQIAPGITHEGTTEYSDFLYGTTNPIRGVEKTPIITPKSNAILGEYDKPAQIAKIRLQEVFDLLLKFHKCLWWIEDNKLKIEHIEYFERGKSYTTDNIGADLTTLLEPKTGKAWEYQNNVYKYEKSQMSERLEFAWMDEVSPPFEGYPIEVRSKFVQKGNVKDERISLFTSDIDFMLAQPGEVAQNGFAFFEAVDNAGQLELPFVTFTIGTDEVYKMQNGYASLVFGHDQYHKYQAPAPLITINQQDITATSVKKNRTQEIDIPDETIDPMELITTAIGNGKVRKIRRKLSTGQKSATVAHTTQ